MSVKQLLCTYHLTVLKNVRRSITFYFYLHRKEINLNRENIFFSPIKHDKDFIIDIIYILKKIVQYLFYNKV
jgi:hypothetical protein